MKRCCGPLLDDPVGLANEHSAVGARVQAWAFETYPEEMKAGLEELLGVARASSSVTPTRSSPVPGC